MATTTPNFGWSVPTSTDLVKDGATAIETLGDSIDASMADLKGGTTGQILAKNSNTDMDFVWSAAGMANPMTTTGDLIYSSSGSTPARRAIGTTGQILTVSGGVPTWATPAGGGKLLQVVSATTSTSTNTNSTTYADITNMSVTITPSASTSKILIMWASNNESGVSGYDDAIGYAFFQLLRGASVLVTDQRASYTDSSGTGGNGRSLATAFAFNYLDSPASTSALTYKFQGSRQTKGGTQFCYWGSSYQQTLIAFEIGA